MRRDRDEHVEGLSESHDLELLLDKGRVQVFTVKPPQGESAHATVDQHLKTRVSVRAGPHAVGVAFLKNHRSCRKRRVSRNRRASIRSGIRGFSPRSTPFRSSDHAAEGPGDTPSRRRIFLSQPASPARDDRSAKQILASLMRRACPAPGDGRRRRGPLALYRNARADGGFEAGIEMALSAVLVGPQFLFRVEHDPVGVAPNAVYRVSDLELASRLSFFSGAAFPTTSCSGRRVRGRSVSRRGWNEKRGGCSPTRGRRRWCATSRRSGCTFGTSTRSLRICACSRTSTTTSVRPFAGKPSCFSSILREDRSVLDLLRADYTFVNERLAKHYGIPHVYGSRFRRVALKEDSWRGGLLRHGSILTVTSYATRTSPSSAANGFSTICSASLHRLRYLTWPP